MADNFDPDEFQSETLHNQIVPSHETLMAALEKNIKLFEEVKRRYATICELESETILLPRSRFVVNSILNLLLYKTQEKIEIVMTMKKNLLKSKSMRSLIWHAFLDFTEAQERDKHAIIELLRLLVNELAEHEMF